MIPQTRRKVQYTPGQDLLLRVRVGLLAQRTSLNRKAKELGFSHGNARQALLGGWTGPKAAALVMKLIEESGVTR
jgi:hypothetical protein